MNTKKTHLIVVIGPHILISYRLDQWLLNQKLTTPNAPKDTIYIDLEPNGTFKTLNTNQNEQQSS